MSRFTPEMRALDWLVARPIAHRGLHDARQHVVENTASAFAGAIAGDYAIECDLQLSSDGEAIVYHDETLDRLSNGTGLILRHSVAQLRKVPFKQGRDHIQTLDELLEQVGGRVPLVIELKSTWNGSTDLATRALKILEPYAGPYALMSFDPDLVAAVAELSPNTVRGITADRAVDDYYRAIPLNRRLEMRFLSHLAKTRPHFASFAFRELPFAPIQNYRAAGFPVITWTIRSAAEAAMARRYSDQITFEGFAA
jgi:glycerophosphoryl diester phosphodiesterase